jgi:protein SCO1/2
MNRRLAIVVVMGFLIGALAGAFILALNASSNSHRVESSGKALVGGPFALIDQNGKPVTEQDFRGRYMLVFFGFTHCPDICPAELQVMAASLDQLGDQASKVVPVFVTLDPARDTPEAIAAYVKNFGPRFVGLTGSPESIDRMAKEYRVAYSKFQDKDSGNDYSIDHSTLVYLMGPDGEFIMHFAFGTSAAQMIDTLRRYL